MEYISTSALANRLNIKSSDLFNSLEVLGWIERSNEKWILTDFGKRKGGQSKTSDKFGQYIVWPESINIESNEQKPNMKLLNATAIGKHFGISSQRLNLVLSEIGWIERDITGWQVSRFGGSIGGRQYEHNLSGATYVLWPESILENKSLKEVFKEEQNENDTQKSIITETRLDSNSAPTVNNFREKFPGTIRTRDGHMVRSRAEVIIDNALYEYKLAHAYERKLPIEEELYSDFYLPGESVYIEFWGIENDAKYLERKRIKLAVYKKYDFKLIELTDGDISNLDDNLPKKLLKYNIKVF